MCNNSDDERDAALVSYNEALKLFKAVGANLGEANVLKAIGDMPYMTYQPSVETAIRNVGRFMSEAGCDAIKLEGGAAMADRIKGIVDSGIQRTFGVSHPTLASWLKKRRKQPEARRNTLTR